MLTCSVIEGENRRTAQKRSPTTSLRHGQDLAGDLLDPRGMTSFEYMSRIGPNHDANSFGLIGADDGHAQRHAAHSRSTCTPV